MNQQLTILLYSKYSNQCTNLIDLIQQSKVDFSTLQLLCIDNKKVRQRIHKDKKIQVTTVPCILDIFSTGIIEKYDNISAFQWVHSIISKFSPPTPPTQPTPQNYQPIYLPHNNIPKQKSTRKKDVESESESEEEEIKIKKKSKSKKSIKKVFTSIEDLSSEEEDINKMRRREASKTSRKNQGNQDRFESQKPVKRIRQDSNNFVIDESLFNDEKIDSHSVDVSRAIKNTNDDGKSSGGDLMSRAHAFAKSREKDDKQNRPPGLVENIKD